MCPYPINIITVDNSFMQFRLTNSRPIRLNKTDHFKNMTCFFSVSTTHRAIRSFDNASMKLVDLMQNVCVFSNYF